MTGILRGMSQLSKDERAKLGQAANTVKKELEAELAKRKAVIGEKMQALRFEKEALDVTEPGKPGRALGRLHPMTQTYREIRDAWWEWGSPLTRDPRWSMTTITLPS